MEITNGSAPPRALVPPRAMSTVARDLGAVLLLGVGLASIALALQPVPAPVIWDGIRVLGVGIVLAFSISAARQSPIGRQRVVFLVWSILLITERLFFRDGEAYANEAAYVGNFNPAAYSEVIVWILCLFALLIVTNMSHIGGRMFAGSHKWVALFALVCLLSCVYAPRPLFGLAWAFKLSLISLVLVLCMAEMRNVRDIARFFQFTLWAFAFHVLLPIVLAAITGPLFDAEGRLGTLVNPDGLSADAGTLLLLALTLYSRTHNAGMRKSAMILTATGFVVMVVAGGKAGIIAGLLSGAIFMLLRRGIGPTVRYAIVATVSAVLLATVTPLSGYLTHYGADNGVTTLSGRTLLWGAVLPAIERSPIFGHGYLASTFIAIQVNAVGWSAPHLHNGFLEVLYNSGLVGLLCILAIHLVVVMNLIRVIRRAPSTEFIHQIGVGCFALYLNFLIDGLFNSSFGGRARPPFMALLALVFVSEKLVALLPQRRVNEEALTGR